MTDEQLIQKFEEYYGEGEAPRLFFAPGRVNLIGEHIDYNGGCVFPAALCIGISAVVRANNTSAIEMRSLNAAEILSIDLNNPIVSCGNEWTNYPKGVIVHLQKEGFALQGCQVLFYSNLPEGAGLSSSAALEVLTAQMLLSIANASMKKSHIAVLCQRVENQFINVNCGIMDQFAVAMGKKNNALLLNCENLNYQYFPIDLGEFSLVIMNTNKKRTLATSKYNERKSECDAAIAELKKHIPLTNLCEATLAQVEMYLHDPLLIKRARHAVTENARVHAAAKALVAKDLVQFAALLSSSHQSLKNDYEVSGIELDCIVEESLKTDGCIGARMTGAGFGGCAIAIVESAKVALFKEKVLNNYYHKIKITPSFYESKIGEGVHEKKIYVPH